MLLCLNLWISAPLLTRFWFSSHQGMSWAPRLLCHFFCLFSVPPSWPWDWSGRHFRIWIPKIRSPLSSLKTSMMLKSLARFSPVIRTNISLRLGRRSSGRKSNFCSRCLLVSSVSTFFCKHLQSLVQSFSPSSRDFFFLSLWLYLQSVSAQLQVK